jgi:hypothetical protein
LPTSVSDPVIKYPDGWIEIITHSAKEIGSPQALIERSCYNRKPNF